MKRRFYIILVLTLILGFAESCKSRRNRCTACPTWSFIQDDNQSSESRS